MLSGKGGTVAKTRGQMVGAAEYLTKPFSPQELLAAVRRNLKEPASEPAATAARLSPAPIAAEV
jgi:DNA-binding response OmpR family regulator